MNGSFQFMGTEETKEGIYHSHIKLIDGMKTNALLSYLIEKVEVLSFAENIPSMNDIFISMVKEDEDE